MEEVGLKYNVEYCSRRGGETWIVAFRDLWAARLATSPTRKGHHVMFLKLYMVFDSSVLSCERSMRKIRMRRETWDRIFITN